MLGFININYRLNPHFKSVYKFIYDKKGLPYLITDKLKWEVIYLIGGVPYKHGMYMENNGTYYLMYEEPCFYK